MLLIQIWVNSFLFWQINKLIAFRVVPVPNLPHQKLFVQTDRLHIADSWIAVRFIPEDSVLQYFNQMKCIKLPTLHWRFNIMKPFEQWKLNPGSFPKQFQCVRPKLPFWTIWKFLIMLSLDFIMIFHFELTWIVVHKHTWHLHSIRVNQEKNHSQKIHEFP